MSPAARKAARDEHTHGETGAGVQFTPKVANVKGVVAWGPLRKSYDLSEAATDGAVHTQDLHLASALRGTGVFAEQQL